MSFNSPSHPDYLNVPSNAEFDPLLDVNWKPLELPKPPAGLSGGEVSEETAALRLEMITKISAQEDVREVLALAICGDGFFLYLIATPFLNSYPRYVIGKCDRKLETVSPLFLCESRWSADAEWHRIRHGENHHLYV